MSMSTRMTAEFPAQVWCPFPSSSRRWLTSATADLLSLSPSTRALRNWPATAPSGAASPPAARRWPCWDARKQSTRCQRSGWSLIGWLLAEHRFLMSRPSCPCWLRGCPGRAATGRLMRSECGSDQTQRAYSRADGTTPDDSAHV